ncbi:MAG: hypothetical protein LBT69_03965 [Lactobacillales bacterium]|jgi:hypothetical protein|nr:hypothetical protein [Lactobacillales bacterium]
MKKKEQLLMVGQYADFSLEGLQEALFDWLSLARILTIPMIFRENKKQRVLFDLDDVTQRIKMISKETDVWWSLEAGNAKFQVHVRGKTLFCSNFLSKELFAKYESLIDNYFVSRLEENGIFGYLRSSDEYEFNNISHLKLRTFDTPEELEKLPKCYDSDWNVAVDCNQLAGYDLLHEGLMLTSCWRMFFSKHYYCYVPKAVFEAVQQVYQVRSHKSDLLEITLFKDPWNWDAEVNLNYQRLFRDQVGFDQLAWGNGVGLLREPYIEFAFEERCVHTVSYLDQQGQPISKKQASIFVTRSYDFKEGQYVEHHLKGRLNAQAFFPWIDESKKKMMNYCVLNPEYALDKGACAFEFYIREFLELELDEDSSYHQYLPILRFYIPKIEMFKVPFEIVSKKMSDVEFQKIKYPGNDPTFDLKKGENRLRIVFMDYAKLMKSNEFSTNQAEL